jgi:hypothetical protein
VTKNWSITPDIGNGLNFNTATGVLSGTPLVAQNTPAYQTDASIVLSFFRYQQ